MDRKDTVGTAEVRGGKEKNRVEREGDGELLLRRRDVGRGHKGVRYLKQKGLSQDSSCFFSETDEQFVY